MATLRRYFAVADLVPPCLGDGGTTFCGLVVRVQEGDMTMEEKSGLNRRPKTRDYEPEELTSVQVQELRKALIVLRDEILAKNQSRRKEGMYEISRDDLADEADLASAETAQEVGLKLAEHELKRLELVQRALKKVESNDGMYGLCEGTGEPIGFRRLQLQPWTPYSLRHQEELERGKRSPA
jgi:DnaK suppressor protein